MLCNVTPTHTTFAQRFRLLSQWLYILGMDGEIIEAFEDGRRRSKERGSGEKGLCLGMVFYRTA